MKNSPLVYYYDKECQNRYPVNERGTAVVDWGETIPGQTKEIVLYAQNKTLDRLVLRQPYTLDEDLKITDYPVNLMGKESGKVVMQFQPNEERIDPLKSGWGFDVIVG